MTPDESAGLLSSMLFDITNAGATKLVELRDFDEIKSKGPFKYSGLADTLFKECFMPEDVYQSLKQAGIDRHVGPSCLRVKSLLTLEEARNIFGRQLAYAINNYLKENPPKKDGYLVCVPNMTGGAWIGDETRKHLQDISREHKIWSGTPYARGARKAIDVKAGQAKFIDFVEGVMPTIDDTSVIFVFEELRTAAETTQNAIDTDRMFGYGENNGIRIVAVCAFDYRHPAGVERLKRLNIDGLYAVGGQKFFDASLDRGYVTDSQHATGTAWLSSPWEFTRKILPYLK